MDLDLMKNMMDSFLDADGTREFYVGENTSELMAKAALNVLYAIKDTNDYLKKEGHID